MKLSEFTFRLLFLFLPGIISLVIVKRLIVSKDTTPFYFTLYSFVLGVLSYLTLSIVMYLYVWVRKIISSSNVVYRKDIVFFEVLFDAKPEPETFEVLWACFISIVLGIAISAAINHKILTRFAQYLRVTKKFGENDVWSYILNSDNQYVPWVVIRDPKNNLGYEGWIEAFSDYHVTNELFLIDVIVFENSSNDELYRLPGLYITRNRESLNIEFIDPKFDDEGENDEQETSNT